MTMGIGRPSGSAFPPPHPSDMIAPLVTTIPSGPTSGLQGSMAVYTEVSDAALADFLAEYDIGRAVSCKGIAEGVENSNYLLFTELGPFILTLYEKRVDAADLPFFLGLMEHLAENGVDCPTPIHGRDGNVLRMLCGRPAAITSFLKGVSPKRPNPQQCAEVGAALARMHIAGRDYTIRRKNALAHEGLRHLF